MATDPSTDAGRRIVTLDIIRGIAVMGIFSVNVVAFAMIEAAYFNPAAYGTRSSADLFVWGANMLLIDGKLRSLFSMLFGASMLLVIERAEAAGESGWWVHARRMVVLLAFGLLHYFFIWSEDILTLYAVAGLIAFLFRRKASERLIGIGLVFLVLHMLLFAGFIFHMYGVQAAALAPGATDQAIKEWNESLGSMAPTAAAIATDKAIYLGSFPAFASHQLGTWPQLIAQTIVLLPDTIGLMLLGMAGFKSGFLTGSWDDRRYRQIAVWGVLVGLVGGAGVIAADVASSFDVVTVMGAFGMADTPFITAMAVGYAALIILLSRRLGPLWRRVAAAGRCAFTNYLGTSLIATFVFYGWGLGLYGSVSRWQAWLLVPVVWAIMLLWSKPWLERFTYGPFEWAWRSLSRGKLQPMRTRLPQAAAVEA